MIIFLPTSIIIGWVAVLIVLILEKLVKGFERIELAKFLSKKIL